MTEVEDDVRALARAVAPLHELAAALPPGALQTDPGIVEA